MSKRYWVTWDRNTIGTFYDDKNEAEAFAISLRESPETKRVDLKDRVTGVITQVKPPIAKASDPVSSDR